MMKLKNNQINLQGDTTKELKPSEQLSPKDKSLKDVNTSESELYTESENKGVSDEEFKNKGIDSPYDNPEDESLQMNHN